MANAAFVWYPPLMATASMQKRCFKSTLVFQVLLKLAGGIAIRMPK
ncbi:hypothetical protein HMPREF9554_02020 [Treponema phagedenis F0421]|nr:hypothetical protein HMPREF9554_02020 [Treponema phagedenis F0421]